MQPTAGSAENISLVLLVFLRREWGEELPVVGTDGKIAHLQAGNAVDVEAFIDHAVLDNVVALDGSHRAGAQRVPCCFNMTGD